MPVLIQGGHSPRQTRRSAKESLEVLVAPAVETSIAVEDAVENRDDIAVLFRVDFQGVLGTIAPLSRGSQKAV